MTHNTARTLLGLSLLVCGIPSGRADQIAITFLGTISPYQYSLTRIAVGPTIDSVGLFGPPGASLTGDPFQVVWRIDAINSPQMISGSNPNGGSGTFSLSGTLTINGQSLVYGTSGYLDGIAKTDYAQMFVNMTVNLTGNAMDTFIAGDRNSQIMPGDSLLTPFSYAFNPSTDNLNFPHQLGGSFSFNGVGGYFSVESVNLSMVPIMPVGTGLPGMLLAAAVVAYRALRRKGKHHVAAQGVQDGC